jgi:hypothetical protein
MATDDVVTMLPKKDAVSSTDIQRKSIVSDTLHEASRKRQSLSDLFTIVRLASPTLIQPMSR